MPSRNRDEFRSPLVAALAKRSGYLCAICRAMTIGPSSESPLSVTNLGVAAHITAAAPGGPRFDPSLTHEKRCAIENGIWLCQTDAKRIDADSSTYTDKVLHSVKAKHEAFVATIAGIPASTAHPLSITPGEGVRGMTAHEYAFLRISETGAVYRGVLAPILSDRKIGLDEEVGILMCTGPQRDDRPGPEWTAFVSADWLRWFLGGQEAGYKAAGTLSPSHILGCIPAWPDSFLEWLAAIVESGVVFTWQRHPHGYLVLSQ